MDLDFLFWLAILAIYILQAVASKRKQQQGGFPEQEGASPDEVPDDLQTALGEIGRILRGETDPTPAPPQAPAPRPSPSQASAPRPLPSQPPAPYPPPSRTSRPLGPALPPKRSPSPFDRTIKAGKFYDEPFEQKTAKTFRTPVITHDHEFEFRPAAEVPAAPVVSVPDLSDPQALRDAFVASEILGPPVSRRRRR